MSYWPLLAFHVCAGASGLLCGAVAMSLRKGSPRHRMAGNAFVVTMLSMAGSAVYVGLLKHQTGNCLIAFLTAYLVATAWMTARRRDGDTGIFEIGALMAALALGAGFAIYGFEAAHSPTGRIDGHPALKYFIFGLVALFSAAGDVRVLLGSGVSKAHRVARHLWRMSFSLVMAADALFRGQARLFPEAIRRTHVLYAPIVLIIVLMGFWIVRVLFANASRGKLMTFTRYGVDQ